MGLTARGPFTKGHGSEPFTSWFGFAPNTASNPLSASYFGPMKALISSIAYSATGIYTVTFKSSVSFVGKPHFSVQGQADAGGTLWAATLLGPTWANATKQIVIQAYSGSVAGFQVPASANNLIRVRLDVDLTDAT